MKPGNYHYLKNSENLRSYKAQQKIFDCLFGNRQKWTKIQIKTVDIKKVFDTYNIRELQKKIQYHIKSRLDNIRKHKIYKNVHFVTSHGNK